MNKKTFFIILITLIVLAVIAGWVYFLFFKKNPSPETPPAISTAPIVSGSSAPTPTSKPTTPYEQKFEVLTIAPVLSPVIQDNKIIFFNLAEKMFKSLTAQLKTVQEQSLIESKFEHITAITWSPNKNFVLAQFSENGQIRYSIVDIKQNLSYVLPFYLTDFAWSPDEKRLVANHYFPVKNEFFISTIKPDGSDEQKLTTIQIKNINLAWPSLDIVLFWEKPAYQEITEKIFSYNIKLKVLSDIPLPFYDNGQSGARGLIALPSPDGKRLFLSYANTENNAVLSGIYNRDTKIDSKIDAPPLTGVITNMPFSTIPEKCSWAPNGESIYCAYADEFTSGKYTVPFGYWTGDFSTNDSFARFNWKTGEMKVYAEKTEFDATDVSVSPDESFLIFINRKDMNLYKMKL